MSLICFASGKGAPGVTLTALGFAAARATAGRKVVLLEADRSGGTLAVRYQLPRQPGLITLAAAGRHGLSRDELWNHAQELPGGLAAIVAPEREDRTSAILRSDGQRLGRWLADISDIDVVADCGRIDSDAVSSGIPSQADTLYLLARPTAEDIQPSAALAAAALDQGISVSWFSSETSLTIQPRSQASPASRSPPCSQTIGVVHKRCSMVGPTAVASAAASRERSHHSRTNRRTYCQRRTKSCLR